MRLSLPELMLITAKNAQDIKSLRKRSSLGLAWGRGDAYESLSYLPLDAVGMLLTDALGKAYNGKGYGGLAETSAMVRVHCDVWARCVAEAEKEYKEATTRNVRFCIVDFERATDGKKAHLAGGSSETSEEAIAAVIAASPQARGYIATRINCVNVSYLLTFIRTQAMRHDIDLTKPFTFMPHPDSKKFAELMQPFEERKASAIAEVAGRKKREAEVRKIGELVRERAEAILQ